MPAASIVAIRQVSEIPLGPKCMHPALSSFTPDGRWCLAACQDTDNVALIDCRAHRLVAAVSLPDGDVPWGVAVSPDGRFGYVTNSGFSEQGRHRRGRGTVSIIDIARRKAVGSIKVGVGPNGIAANKRYGRLFVANTRDNTVSVIDLQSHKAVATLKVGRSPLSVIGSPNDSSIVVVNYYDATVSVIDPEELKIIRTIKTGTPGLKAPYPEWGEGDSVNFVFTEEKTGWAINFRSRNLVCVQLDSGTRDERLDVPEMLPFGVRLFHKQTGLCFCENISPFKILDLGPRTARRRIVANVALDMTTAGLRAQIVDIPQGGTEMWIPEARRHVMLTIPLAQFMTAMKGR